MDTPFHQQVNEFLKLAADLHKAGLKKKEIARYLDIHASAYSTLVNNIFAEIAKYAPNSPALNNKIAALFNNVNNVSERKVRQKIQSFIDRLEQLKSEVKDEQFNRSKSYIEGLVEDSPVEILEKLVGIYECYYVSSFGYRVKCEPFMITKKKNEPRFMAYKGNKLSPGSFAGFLYVSNNHILTVQMLEEGTISKDHFIIHFILPPTYQQSLSFLKGISVSISNAYFPIGRKVVLKKINASPSFEAYEKMETNFFEDEIPVDDRIINYLRTSNSLIEYIPIPHPSFDERDLQKELAVREVLKTN